MSDATEEAQILIEDRDRVRVLTLNRPSALNAFSYSMFAAIQQALEDARADDSIGAVLLRAEGRAFTSGSDLSGEEPPEPHPYDSFIEEVETFSKPLVAAINGLAVGIGTTLLGHCDIVIGSTSARFRMPFASLGLVPEAGSTVNLPAMLGRQRAAHALFTAEWVSAEQALEGGLLLEVVPPEDLDERALEICRGIAAMPVESLVGTKELLLAARLPAARAARDREEPEFRRLLEGPAHAEALRAFAEKREPNFHGRLHSSGVD